MKTFAINNNIYIKIVLFILIIGSLSFAYTFGIRKYAGYYHWKNGSDLVVQGKWAEAIKEYRYSEKEFPRNPQLMFCLGSAYLNSDSIENAKYYLEKSFIRNKDRNCYIMLGFTYKKLGNIKASEEIFKEMSSNYPNLLLPQLLLGKLYYDARNYADAKKSLITVLDKKPRIDNPLARIIKEEADNLLTVMKRNNL